MDNKGDAAVEKVFVTRDEPLQINSNTHLPLARLFAAAASDWCSRRNDDATVASTRATAAHSSQTPG